MRLTIEPTPFIVHVNGEPARVWRGTDDQGVPVEVHVRTVSPQTHDAGVNDRYARELVEVGAERGGPPLMTTAAAIAREPTPAEQITLIICFTVVTLAVLAFFFLLMRDS